MFRIFSCFVLAVVPATLIGQDVSFVRDVRPILSDKCFPCHGPDANTRETELRLDTEASAKSDLGGYFAIVDGDPTASELIERITTDDEYMVMPPEDSHLELTAQQKKILQDWIAQGAAWSDHWAYLEPVPHETPSTGESWAETWIDQFLFQRLESEGLEPSPDADRVTLGRRLYFDLIGLPPTPEQIDLFVSGNQSVEELVDELLASRHFGERMAVYWLDLVRFADTVGYHGDQDHNITPYRDWVIDAFNANMPFDQFTREQLAGDLLPQSTIDQKIASGYNRLLQTSHEGGVQPKEYLAIYAADRVRNVSDVWMGATVGCAQCHDHKYDPYTAKDFYSMAAFFADLDDDKHFTKGTNALPTARPPEIKVLGKAERQQLAKLQEEREQLSQASTEGADAARLQQIDDAIARIEALARVTMISVALDEPRVTRVLPRGNWLDDSGEIVQPAVPHFMPQITGDGRASRLDLANWLVDPDNGSGQLTARVFVNRLWAMFFGVGLCPSLDDFGGQGVPPVHAELLDRLAIEFVESRWDIKQLVKTIVGSRAYRMSSAADPRLRSIDPENLLLARQSSFRLPAEFVRDNALAVSGLLNRTIGGGSVKPFQPEGYYRHLNFPPRTYHHDQDDRQWRRGLYVHWQRQFLHPMLYAFDAPRREECTAQRSRSNTPSAALVLLNDPTFVHAAVALAQKTLESSAESDEDRLQWIFKRTLSRDPDATEQRLLMELIKSNRTNYLADPQLAQQLVGDYGADGDSNRGDSSRADSNRNELQLTELATWTMVARALLNLGETTFRN